MTGYTIQILNMTDMTTRYQDVGLNHTYDEDVQDVAVKCNNLVFIVTAFNEMGNATGEVSGGFPIGEFVIHTQSNKAYSFIDTPIRIINLCSHCHTRG